MLQWFARRMKEAEEDEKGFTLIELLIVVIIIGILMGIAVPIYLNQRNDAANSAAQANVTAASTAEAAHYAAKGAFTKTEADLAPYGFPTNEEPAVTIDAKTDATNYCVSATSTAATPTTYYAGDSASTGSTTRPGDCT